MSNKNRSFIIIDDDKVFNQTLCRALQRKEKLTIPAFNSEQALATVTDEKPDCAILDLCLGSENGIDLIPPLLKAHPKLKIVVLTGYASLSTAVQAIKLGAWNYSTKHADVGAIIHAFNYEKDKISATDISPQISLNRLEGEVSSAGFIRKEWQCFYY